MPSICRLWLIITLRTRTSILAMLNGNTTYNFFSFIMTSLDLSTIVNNDLIKVTFKLTHDVVLIE
jgi:hypothetical protein